MVRVDAPGPLPISRLDLPPDDLGFAGAKLGTADNATTGSFMKQTFTVETVAATPETAAAEMQKLVDAGVWWIVVMADADTTVKLADIAGDKAIVLNAEATDDRLRGEDCRANLLHTAPSDAMLTDALAQYLVKKRWNRWFLIEGSHPEDQALAAAYGRAAKKFGAKVVEETRLRGHRRGAEDRLRVGAGAGADARLHPASAGARRGGRGGPGRGLRGAAAVSHLGPAAGGRLGGAGAGDLASGARGLGRDAVPDPLREGSARPARDEDYQVWMALRVLGEAATRTQGGDFQAIHDFVLSDKLELAAFKGQKLSFRDWDGQLRAADPADDRQGGGLGLAAGRVPAPGEPARHARDRPARDGLQEMTGGSMRKAPFSADPALLPLRVVREPGSGGEDLRLEREGQHRSRVLDGESLEVIHTIEGLQRPRGITVSPDGKHVYVCSVGRRPRAGRSTRTPTRSSRACPSGADPELFVLRPTGNPLYVANEDDNIVTVVDVNTQQVLAEVPVGVEPEGMGVSPDGKIAGQHLRDHQHGAPDRHLDLRDRRQRAGRQPAALRAVHPRRIEAPGLGRDRRDGQRDRHGLATR